MNTNFKNFGNEPPGDGGGRLQGNLSLARQTSIYSLTFDELQCTMGGPGKDFGSMNMDELLKSIWSAEETQTQTQTQTVGSTSGVQEGGVPGGYLQRQGSLTLPRTLSQKTVDEVWRGISKDYSGGVKDERVLGVSNMPQTQRQPTLGEITLEEFLVRAGVVREDAQPMEKPSNDNGLFGNFLQSENNPSFVGFQQTGQNLGLIENRTADSTNQFAFQSSNLPLNIKEGRSSQQQLPILQPQLQQRQHQQLQPQQQQRQQQQQQQPQKQQQQQIFPKQPTLAYATPIPIQSSAQLGSPGIRGGTLGVSGISDPGMNGNLVQTAALQGGGLGMVSLGAGAVTVATGSPAVSSDGLGKSNGDTSSVSPIPYIFNGGLRGKKCSTVEKVVERRQRRMIKNRESAARSRARKQAYTMELEAEVAKLKEENEELLKKQAEIMEMQKNLVLEMMDKERGARRRCLRRIQTAPW